MNQATLELDTTAPPDATAVGDRTGFELGWDHAHHGLVPAAELLRDGVPVGQGWRAGRAVFRGRTLQPTRWVRRWLALRTSALQRGLGFDAALLTAADLALIDVSHCPVTRQLLGGVAGSADAPVVERLSDAAGYTVGNLAVVSQRAASAKASLGVDAGAALRRARRIDAGIDAAGDALAPHEHWRVAVLMSFAAPLPFAEAARVPLRVLPPSGVRPANAVQRLQALLTLQFTKPGWSARVRALSDLLPAVKDGRALRHDFNLFVGALAPRLIEAAAGRDARAIRHALEDAWADERVNRRWQQLALALGEASVEALLGTVSAAAPASSAKTPQKPVETTAASAPIANRRVARRAVVAGAQPPLAQRTMRPAASSSTGALLHC